MKTSVAPKDNDNDLKFPCLMVSEYGSIYLITHRKNNYEFAGTKIHSGGDDDINGLGKHWCWNIASLKPYYGSVTLSSDD